MLEPRVNLGMASVAKRYQVPATVKPTILYQDDVMTDVRLTATGKAPDKD